MITQTTKLIGTEITSDTVFKNILKEKFAPQLVRFKYKPPNGEIVTTIVSPDLMTLHYSFTILLDVAGTWKFRWESIGAHASAEEFEVFVDETILK
jgi:hypothetical protein